ncbi:MAG: Fe-S cluster protein [Gemmatimonadetes bacterium]|nr:Fe-S cluster protein [Gemmatimonadota bacterium]
MVLVSSLILGGVGLTFGALIAVANKKLKVWEDPRIEAVNEMLPGSNCGACGYAGCRSFAEGVVGVAAQPAHCTQMTPVSIEMVAGLLGVEAGEAQKKVARLLCAGGSAVAIRDAEYLGVQTCIAAAAVAGGGKCCYWGCLGLADCEVVCDYDAIRMNDQDLPIVDPELCTACGDCVEACPKDLFTIMPIEQALIVQCMSELEGDRAEELCSVACTACGRCVSDAAEGLIEMGRGLPVVDYTKSDLADRAATKSCPTGAIRWVEGAQILDPELERSGRTAG